MGKSHPLNDVVFCKLAPSPIHGVGVFAIRDIPKGTELAGGRRDYPRAGMETILPEIMQIIQDHWLFIENPSHCEVIPNPNYDVHLQCFMNHSYKPNSDGFRALRDIKAGEEITEDFTDFPIKLGPKALAQFNFL